MSIFLGLPVVSILLFVLAGFLIGHLVWYRDRNGDDKRIVELEEKYAAANGAAETHRQEFLDLKKSQTISQSDYDHLHQQTTELANHTESLRDQLQTEIQRNEALTAQLDEVLAAKESYESIHGRNEDVIRQAGDELGRQTEIIEDQRVEIQRLEALLQQSDPASTSDSQAEQTIQELRHQLVESSQQAEQVAEQNDVLEGVVAEKENRIRELESAVEQSSVELVEIKSQLAESVEQVPESFVAENNSLLQQFQETHAASESMRETLTQQAEKIQLLTTENDSLKEMVQDNESLRATIGQRESEIEELRKAGEEIDRLKAELDSAGNVIKTANSEHSRITTLLGDKQTELADLKNQLSEVEQFRSEMSVIRDQMETAEKTAAELRDVNEKQADQIVRLNRELKKVETLEQQLDQSVADLKDMQHQSELQTKAYAEQRAEVQQLRAAAGEAEAAKRNLENVNERYSSVSAERQQLVQSQAELEKQVKQLTSELHSQSSSSDQLRKELDARNKAYEQAISDSRQFASSLKQQQVAIATMERDLKTAQAMQPENQKLQNEILQLRAALKELSTEHDQSLAANAKAQSSIRDLQNEVHEATQTIRELRRPRGSIFQFGNSDEEHRRAA